MNADAVVAMDAETVDAGASTDTDLARAEVEAASARAVRARDDEPTHFYILICECCGKTYGMQPNRPGRRLRCASCVARPPPQRLPARVVQQEKTCDRGALCDLLLALLVVIMCAALLVIVFVLA